MSSVALGVEAPLGARAASAPLCRHCALPLSGSRPGRRESVPEFCCFGCRMAAELSRPAADSASGGRASTLLLRLGLGVFVSMNIMVFSWLNYARELLGVEVGGAQEEALAGLFSYLLLLLATIVMATLGAPLLHDALFGADGRLRLRIDANLLIGVGVGAAYLLSAIQTLSGGRGLYYDTAAVILVLVTLGNWLESRARREAVASARALLASLPARAWVERGDELVEVGVETLAVGDRLRVRPGESVAADGVVVEGRSHVDEAALTGESRPRAVGPGDHVLAGSLSRDGQVQVEATRVGAERAIARAQALLEVARREQPPIQRLADRVAGVFVPGVVLLALVVFGLAAAAGEPTRGLLDGLSVLLIACPCALGLAAPLAMHFALNRAARLGVLVDSAATLERAAGLGRVLLDKTGTLSDGRLALTGMGAMAAGSEQEALRLAAALESSSRHPVAEALVAAAVARQIPLAAVTEAQALPGLGVTGRVEGRRLWLGSERLVRERGFEPPPAAERGGEAVVMLLDERGVVAWFALAESARADARSALAELGKLGIEVEILTGDGAGPARRMADALGVPFASGLLPEDKLERLRRLRASGGRAGVGMVGDGINDAPVLAAADVGFALGGGTDLARAASHVLVLGDRLGRVPETIRIARHAMRRVRLNLFWAFAYNLVGVTLAASGLLTPVFSAIAMFGSSLFVIHTSRGAGAVPSAPDGERA